MKTPSVDSVNWASSISPFMSESMTVTVLTWEVEFL